MTLLSFSLHRHPNKTLIGIARRILTIANCSKVLSHFVGNILSLHFERLFKNNKVLALYIFYDYYQVNSQINHIISDAAISSADMTDGMPIAREKWSKEHCMNHDIFDSDFSTAYTYNQFYLFVCVCINYKLKSTYDTYWPENWFLYKNFHSTKHKHHRDHLINVISRLSVVCQFI